jgi:predicted DsbA family dithiol-disulfide isomerase
VKVEIWSDVVCPWCYIGKRRFEAALERFEHRDDVEVVWRSFELDPSAPTQRAGALDEHLAAKYAMTLDDARAMQAQMTQAAADEGLIFRFDRARSGNTLDAHRLIHLAAERGVQDAVKERLLLAYFSEGAPVSDRDTLLRLAVEAGMDADDVRGVLASDAYVDAVRADEREAAALGIRGVPFFVIERTYGVSGAQPGDVLLEVLAKAWADAHSLTTVGGRSPSAGACDDGSCTA